MKRLREPLDVLVVELGANDGLRGQDPDATASNLRAIVALVRDRYPNVPVILGGMEAPPNLGEDYKAREVQMYASRNSVEIGSEWLQVTSHLPHRLHSRVRIPTAAAMAGSVTKRTSRSRPAVIRAAAEATRTANSPAYQPLAAAFCACS